jgi:alpha-D-xyloside xylohydrolase
VHIYPGADGRFTLYEDDNETYAYEKGQSARYDLRWDEVARTLTIGARQGSFAGMVKQRTLRVQVMDRTGVGADFRTVVYDGRAITLHFAKPTEEEKR